MPTRRGRAALAARPSEQNRRSGSTRREDVTQGRMLLAGRTCQVGARGYRSSTSAEGEPPVWNRRLRRNAERACPRSRNRAVAEARVHLPRRASEFVRTGPSSAAHRHLKQARAQRIADPRDRPSRRFVVSGMQTTPCDVRPMGALLSNRAAGGAARWTAGSIYSAAWKENTEPADPRSPRCSARASPAEVQAASIERKPGTRESMKARSSVRADKRMTGQGRRAARRHPRALPQPPAAGAIAPMRRPASPMQSRSAGRSRRSALKQSAASPALCDGKKSRSHAPRRATSSGLSSQFLREDRASARPGRISDHPDGPRRVARSRPAGPGDGDQPQVQRIGRCRQRRPCLVRCRMGADGGAQRHRAGDRAARAVPGHPPARQGAGPQARRSIPPPRAGDWPDARHGRWRWPGAGLADAGQNYDDRVGCPRLHPRQPRAPRWPCAT